MHIHEPEIAKKWDEEEHEEKREPRPKHFERGEKESHR